MDGRDGEPDRVVFLSPRQRQVLRLATAGHSDKEIARILALSVPTVRTHLSRLYRNNGFRNRAEAAAAWARRDVAPEGEFEGFGSADNSTAGTAG